MQPTYNLNMQAHSIQIIINGLAELPYKVSASLLHEIQKQLQTQDAQAVAPASEHG